MINKDGKAVRVLKLGKKDDKVRVIIMPCKFEYKENLKYLKLKKRLWSNSNKNRGCNLAASIDFIMASGEGIEPSTGL